MFFLNINDYKQRLKSGKPEGWYLFSGEEDYLKKIYLSELIQTVVEDESLSVFNHVIWSGAEMEPAELREAIQSPPLMQEYKLIEWRHANLSELKENELKFLKEEIFSLKKEYPYAIFAVTATANGFDAGTEKRPTRLGKIFAEAFDILHLPKSTDTQLLSWLKRHFDSEGISVSLDTLNAMLVRVGHSMEILSSEVTKLSSYLKANGESVLTREAVEAVTTSNVESDTFALQNAILDGNAKKAFRALFDMRNKRTEPQIIIGMLAKTYSTLSTVALLSEEGESFADIQKLLGMATYPLQLQLKAAKKLGTKKINEALAALLKADAAAKFGGISGYQAIELFITQNI